MTGTKSSGKLPVRQNRGGAGKVVFECNDRYRAGPIRESVGPTGIPPAGVLIAVVPRCAAGRSFTRSLHPAFFGLAETLVFHLIAPVHQRLFLVVCGLSLCVGKAPASEYHPQPPFAGFAELPRPGQLLVTPGFHYAAFQSYWAGEDEVDISQGDHEYDVEYYSGQVLLEYGLPKHWALDLTLGYVDQATRALNANGGVQKTSGLLDTQFGIRYQVLRDSQRQHWTPDLTLRVGGIFRGTYEENFPFAPGYGETGIEPALFARKVIWPGGGLYASAGYRHLVSYAPDSVLLSAGLFQRWRQFAVLAGYRQQQALTGPDVATPNPTPGSPYNVFYNNRVREINYLAEWGGTYTFPNGIVLRFYMNSNFDGRNTGEKLTYGGAVTLPFQLRR